MISTKYFYRDERYNSNLIKYHCYQQCHVHIMRIIPIINLGKTSSRIPRSVCMATLSPHVYLNSGKLFRRSRLANRITRKEREWRRADLATGSFAAGCLESPRSAAIFTWIESHGWLTPVVFSFIVSKLTESRLLIAECHSLLRGINAWVKVDDRKLTILSLDWKENIMVRYLLSNTQFYSWISNLRI